jgi:uncharacterized protein
VVGRAAGNLRWFWAGRAGQQDQQGVDPRRARTSHRPRCRDRVSDAGPLIPWRLRLRESRLLLLLELALIAALFLADWRHHIYYFSKTPYLLALGWLSLWLRGIPWRDVGFCVPPRWKRLLTLGVVAGVVMEALELFVTQPILVRVLGKYPDLSELRDVVGSVPLMLLMIALAWTLAAVGEELVWRGYIFNRLGDLLGGNRSGPTRIALVVVSAAFGVAHLDQCVTGVIENAINGMLLGLLYLRSGRNLLAPIVAHGITDTLDALIIFSGHYPGL